MEEWKNGRIENEGKVDRWNIRKLEWRNGGMDEW